MAIECQVRQNRWQTLKKPVRNGQNGMLKVKDLERRYREEENSEIHEMVHAANLNPEQLSGAAPYVCCGYGSEA